MGKYKTICAENCELCNKPFRKGNRMCYDYRYKLPNLDRRERYWKSSEKKQIDFTYVDDKILDFIESQHKSDTEELDYKIIVFKLAEKITEKLNISQIDAEQIVDEILFDFQFGGHTVLFGIKEFLSKLSSRGYNITLRTARYHLIHKNFRFTVKNKNAYLFTEKDVFYALSFAKSNMRQRILTTAQGSKH